MPGLTRFEELFGDESYNFSTTPELQDVVPGLIETDSKYASKELNTRRKAVTGRSFRSPVPRSMNPRQMSSPQQEEPEQQQQQQQYTAPTSNHPPPYGPSDRGGPGSFGPEGASSNYLIEMQGETGRLGEGTLGNEIGDSLASSLGTLGLTGAATAALAAIGMGAPMSMMPNILGGSFVSSALNPIALANVVGGGLVAGQMGYNAGNQAAEGFSPNPAATSRSQIAAFNAINPGIGGLAEIGVEGLLGMLGMGESPTSSAESAAGFSFAETVSPHFGTQDQDPNAFNTNLAHEMSGIPNTTAGLKATGPISGPIDADMSAISSEISAASAAASSPIGPQGTISQGLQSLGLGGTSGTMGVGTGGLTSATTGEMGSLFGGTGQNPHASEMGIPSAPTPTVFGEQGHGAGGGSSSGTSPGGSMGPSGTPGAAGMDAGPGGGGGGK